MTLWLILGAIAATVAAILFAGSRRMTAAPDDAADHDLTVYRAQLDELDRDRERGVLEESEVEAARIEVQRRMLAADDARGRSASQRSGHTGWRLPLAIALAVPLGAGALYLWLGNPGIESQPFAERHGEPGQTAEGGALPDVESMMTRLRERLAEDPGDIQGWTTLAGSAFALGDYGEAIAAYQRAIAIDDRPAGLHAALGEAHVMAARGIVTEAARRALEDAVARDPEDPRARYYLAVAQQQDGDREGALAALSALLEDAPADATWVAGVRERAAAIAVDLGLDPAASVPRAGDAAASGSEDAESLAARLQADPKDYEGWIRLARLRAEAGDPDGARAALDSGAEAYQGAPFVLQQLRQAAVELGLEDTASAGRGPSAEDMAAAAEMSPEEQQAMIQGMVAGLAERLEEQPDDAEGWRMLGRSYGVLGDPAKSAEAYGRAAALLPDDPSAQVDYATVLLEASGDGPPPPEAVARLEAVLAKEPDNRDALYYLGAVAARQGDAEIAAVHWQRLLKQLPEGSEDHAWLKARIEALEAQN